MLAMFALDAGFGFGWIDESFLMMDSILLFLCMVVLGLKLRHLMDADGGSLHMTDGTPDLAALPGRLCLCMVVLGLRWSSL